MPDIQIMVFLNDDGSPANIFLSDSVGRIGTPFTPADFSMYEIERLYEKLTPLIEAYKKWHDEVREIGNDKEKKPTTVIPHGYL